MPTTQPQGRTVGPQAPTFNQVNVLLFFIFLGIIFFGLPGWLSYYHIVPTASPTATPTPAVYLGRWSRVASPSETPAPIVGNTSEKELTALECADADALDFLSDGTVWIASESLGGKGGSYTVVDGNRFRVELPGGLIVWKFISYYDDDVLSSNLTDEVSFQDEYQEMNQVFPTSTPLPSDESGFDDEYRGDALSIVGVGECPKTKWIPDN